MGNSLRCCLACVLPCGALDLIRIVHLNGYVEEITRAVTAGEILEAYPNHVLSKPCSEGIVRKILILSPDTELKRGSIYFLLPHSSLPSNHQNINISNSKKPSSTTLSINNQNIKQLDHHHHHHHRPSKQVDAPTVVLDHHNNNNNVVERCDPIFKSKSKSNAGKHQRRRSSRGKSGVWHPHLDSITED